MKKSKTKAKQLTIFDNGDFDIMSWLKVKKNRLKFFKEVYKVWDYRDDDDCYFAGIGYSIEQRNEQLRVYEALSQLGIPFPVIPSLIRYIWEKYWGRITKYVIKKVKENGGYWPMVNPTDTMRILISRGWVHENDTDLNKDEVKLYCHIAPLVWPETYYQHTDALNQLAKIGLPGRTGTKLPKS